MRARPRIPGMILIAALPAFVAAGCVSLDPAAFPLGEGWRNGHVKATGTGEPFRSLVAERCRNPAGDGESGARYATIRVRHAQRSYDVTVPLPRGTDLGESDLVRVNVKDCRLPVVRRQD